MFYYKDLITYFHLTFLFTVQSFTSENEIVEKLQKTVIVVTVTTCSRSSIWYNHHKCTEFTGKSFLDDVTSIVLITILTIILCTVLTCYRAEIFFQFCRVFFR